MLRLDLHNCKIVLHSKHIRRTTVQQKARNKKRIDLKWSCLKDMIDAKFVFIRQDAHHSPLQCPYKGPFKVIHPGDKTFQIDIGGKTETISIDLLKLAHTDFEQPVKVYLPCRRGCQLQR